MNLYQYTPNPLKWVDPLGLAYFAKRPLEGLAWSDSFSDTGVYYTHDLSHEQLFFEDKAQDSPNNLGFFRDSAVKEDEVSLLGGYRRMPQQYDDATMRQAVENVTKAGQTGEYHLTKNNCHDWAVKVRDEYFRLRHEKVREAMYQLLFESKSFNGPRTPKN
jgi:uncharacterized protein RhaS with RHS repeats